MPKINIEEVEQTSPSSLDVTENTVLIPILWIRKDLGSEGLAEQDPPRLINSVNKLLEFAGSGTSAKYVYMDESHTMPDRSYIMAYELLLAGLPVVIKPISFEQEDYKQGNYYVVDEEHYLAELQTGIMVRHDLDEFKDKNTWNIKFITTGGYENLSGVDSEGVGMYETITNIAEARGDAIALIELRKDISSAAELYSEVLSKDLGDKGKLAACTFPWCKFNVTATRTLQEIVMPGCFYYLKAYANSVKTNANWFSVAGVNRGGAPGFVSVLFEVGESLMHVLQGDDCYVGSSYLPVCINPIMNVGTYGYKIWGNRTFYTSHSNKLQYGEILNVRILICDIKKQIYHAALRNTFEPNDDIVWINFKTLANNLLDKMKSGRGLKKYNWVKLQPDGLAEIKANLEITPIEGVETFTIGLVLTDGDVTTNEI